MVGGHLPGRILKMPSVWEIAEGGKGINESKEAGKRRCLDDAGTAGVPPAMSAKREQWLLAVGSFAGGTPAVPANGDHFFLLSL